MADDQIESSPSPMPQIMPKQEIQNKENIVKLYNALAQGDKDTVAGLLATDLEWWFHGPSHCQYMMKVLTGESTVIEFRFEPRSVTAIDDRIIAEGWEGAQAYWVHVWTLKDGLITQFREYFNTWLTVRDLKPVGWAHQSPPLWHSQPRDLFKRSLPGLILGI